MYNEPANGMDCLFQPIIFFVGYGQFMTSFCPAASQYLAPIGRAHAATKTMRAFPSATMWLIGPFHTNLFKWIAKVGKKVFLKNRNPHLLSNKILR